MLAECWLGTCEALVADVTETDDLCHRTPGGAGRSPDHDDRKHLGKIRAVSLVSITHVLGPFPSRQNLTRDSSNVSEARGDLADLQRRRRNAYRRGWPANGEVLRSLLRVREEIAHLAGSRDWASYQTEIRMAGSPDEIRSFLDRIRTAAAPARKRAAAKYLERIRRVDPAVTRLGVAEVGVAGELIRREEYAVDAREIRAHFPFERVKKGVLAIASEFFGLEFRRVDLPVWEPSVEAYEAREQGRLIGRVFLDLHPRPGKVAIGSNRTLRPRITGRQLPEVMVAVGLPGGAPGDPGLTDVANIRTFFHELGHAVQSLLAVRPYVSTGGGLVATTVAVPDEPDFREVPSSMLGHLVEQPVVRRRLSGHVETGAPIPDDLIKRMREAKRSADRWTWGSRSAWRRCRWSCTNARRIRSILTRSRASVCARLRRRSRSRDARSSVNRASVERRVRGEHVHVSLVGRDCPRPVERVRPGQSARTEDGAALRGLDPPARQVAPGIRIGPRVSRQAVRSGELATLVGRG